ncbi:hypothetical protein DCCM_3864 [Desulfocucumis palustris]|uniref:Uncharacterized protein n=1 Tax=Desulfocucumis palustris TaxID=1898651 RepID=A0A2L2XFE8_9FIRM|nr:hypothetical protein DCCM_3864 [Desulfocucumis palustris]
MKQYFHNLLLIVFNRNIKNPSNIYSILNFYFNNFQAEENYAHGTP